MPIDILMVVLILAIAFYQALQGVFSSLIMAILSVLCAVVALNFYEPLALALNARLGAYAHSTVLLALFAVPLLALRTLFDRVIRGNVVMGMWPDRIGGGVFGLITGTSLVGVFMLIVMMLPMPGSFLAYHPYNASLEVEHGGGARKAANFVLGLGRFLSAGSLAPLDRREGDPTFGQAHGDLYLESFCFRNRPPGGRASTPADALEVAGAYRLIDPGMAGDEWKAYVENLRTEQLWDESQIDRLKQDLAILNRQTPKYPLLSPLAETNVYVVRVTVDELARNEKDQWYRLPATHFRLVTGANRSYYPVGYLSFAGRWRVEAGGATPDKAAPANVLVARAWSAEGGPKKLLVDWVYRLPVGEKPREIIFRRAARTRVRTATDAIPPSHDAEGNVIGLTVKPVQGRADFLNPPSRRVIRPLQMECRAGMYSPFYMQLPPDKSKPDIYANAEMGGSYFRRGFVATTVPEIKKHSIRGGGGSSGADDIYQFASPGSGLSIVRVDCRMDRDYPAQDAATMLARINPEIILGNGRTLPHKGAFVAYGSTKDDASIFIYYEPTDAGKLAQHQAEFRRILARNRTTVLDKESLGFVFLVPVREDMSVVGVSFGMGPEYEFYTAKPMQVLRSD
ncbi:MAG TPA: CvpA family protein [Phycisphaerae bacterium]|nr:CvpA family protein [Phycisphaerae bacterium]